MRLYSKKPDEKNEEMTPEALPSVEQREAQVKATTIAKHRQELILIKKLLNHYITGFSKIDKFTISEDNELEYAWLLLTTRSFNSLLCAFDLLQVGYYSQAMMLIRSVFEDWLTAKDSEKNAKTLSALLHGDGNFWKQEGRYSQMAKRVSKEFPETWKNIYGSLSTITHARERALMILIDPKTKELRLSSQYDDNLFLATYQILIWISQIMYECLYRLLGDNATEWWSKILPTAQAALDEIKRIGNKLKDNQT